MTCPHAAPAMYEFLVPSSWRIPESGTWLQVCGWCWLKVRPRPWRYATAPRPFCPGIPDTVMAGVAFERLSES